MGTWNSDTLIRVLLGFPGLEIFERISRRSECGMDNSGYWAGKIPLYNFLRLSLSGQSRRVPGLDVPRWRP
ncbi:MAG: hypothetical protein CM1200mP4_3400 [Rhodospirillaceae bacterium]|nr:MAG: hypothetical protein CM1200mP4_3400 [Rhodospirillaceae bacterium]